MRYDHRDWLSLAALGALAGALLLTQLDQPYLWQDEAQTAVISRTVLTHGIPYGTDGRNFFAQELGIEYGQGYVWRWHTWLPFYAVAASFALFGETTAAARLPFALCGLATVLLGYASGRSFWRSRRTALATGGLLALSVPFLILCRQCRWYPMAALLALLALFAYVRMLRAGPAERRVSLGLFAAATLLFHTHYLYTASLLAALLAHCFLLHRERLPRLIGVCAAVTLVNAPWILWFSQIPYADVYGSYLASFSVKWQIGSQLFRDFVVYFLSPLFLLIPIALGVRRRLLREPVLAVDADVRSVAVLLALFCGTTILALALVAPGAYFRYLTPLVPPAFLLAGALIGALSDVSRAAAVAFFVVWLALSPIRHFVYEITHDFDGPIEGIVRFLEQRAQPGDTVAISYGDMPLKFYTDLRVIGGLTGEDVSEAKGAEWIIIRREPSPGAPQVVKDAVKALLVPGEYMAYRLPYPDTAFENREDPRFHRYRTAPASFERVVVHGRIRSDSRAGEEARGVDDAQRPGNPGDALPAR